MDFFRDRSRSTILTMIGIGLVTVLLAVGGVYLLLFGTKTSDTVLDPVKSDISVNKGVSMVVFTVSGSGTATVTHAPIAVTPQDTLDSNGNVVIKDATVPWQKTVYVKSLDNKNVTLSAQFDSPQNMGMVKRWCTISVNGVTVSNSNAGSEGNTATDTKVTCTAPWSMISHVLTPENQKAGELPQSTK